MVIDKKIPGMAYTVQLHQKDADNFEVTILLHGKAETSTRSRLLDKGSIRRAIATGLRQIGVTVSELSLENVARDLVESAEQKGFPDQESASPGSVLESFKAATNERLEKIEDQLKESLARVERVEERLGL